MRRQIVSYYDKVIAWYFNDKRHRDGDLPALYNIKNRKPFNIAYSKRGNLHRTTGPAYINYRSKIKKYYYEGRRYDSLSELLMMEACG